MNNSIFLATRIVALHDDQILCWKKAITARLTNIDPEFLGLVEKNHLFNFQLWHEEDRARRDDMGHEFVYHAKRAIDQYNQQRNNVMELIDQWLFNALKPSGAVDCPIHSETPGMMIDRLSILALKIYHMQQQAMRSDVDKFHQQNCQQKFTILCAQRIQLMQCFDQLLVDIRTKKRSFTLFHQFKMYNDPQLNPELYRAP